MTFVGKNIEYVDFCLYKNTLTHICYCNLSDMMILGHNYPIKLIITTFTWLFMSLYLC